MIDWLISTTGFLISLALIMAVAWPTRERAGFRMGRCHQVLRGLAVLLVGTLAAAALWGLGSAPAWPGLLSAMFAAFAFGLSVCVAAVYMRRAHSEEMGEQRQQARSVSTRRTTLLLVEEIVE